MRAATAECGRVLYKELEPEVKERQTREGRERRWFGGGGGSDGQCRSSAAGNRSQALIHSQPRGCPPWSIGRQEGGRNRREIPRRGRPVFALGIGDVLLGLVQQQAVVVERVDVLGVVLERAHVHALHVVEVALGVYINL